MSIINTASAHHITNNFGLFEIKVFQDIKGIEHIALVKGKVSKQSKVLCRVFSECITGMVLDSADCDCAAQLNYCMKLIDDTGNGVLILLKQEGRGHGLTTKIKALNYKNQGYDTFSAVEILGKTADCRTYDIAAEIIKSLAIDSINLITSNPTKLASIRAAGIIVENVYYTPMFVNERNKIHLLSKIERGHKFLEK